MKTKVVELLTILERAQTLINEIKDEAVLSNTRAWKKTQSEEEKTGKMDFDELLALTSHEFVTWICGANLPLGKRLDRTILLQQFLSQAKEQSDYVTPKRFSMWLVLYAQYAGLLHKAARGSDRRYSLLLPLTTTANEHTK